MNYNLELHNDLNKLNEDICPYFNEDIAENFPEEDYSCCKNHELESIDGNFTCLNCRQVSSID